MPHVVLLGDSIFDNASYVAGGPAVIDHLRKVLPKDWSATLLAIDGACTPDVERQLRGIPADATHVVLSVGGNDALGVSMAILSEPAGTVREALSYLSAVRDTFRSSYREMLLEHVLSLGKPTFLCTIYDSIPSRLTEAELTGLGLFNDVITREAFKAGLSLIDLRVICNEASDYADVSPIEPSVAGGAKIARAIARAVTESNGGSRVIV